MCVFVTVWTYSAWTMFIVCLDDLCCALVCWELSPMRVWDNELSLLLSNMMSCCWMNESVLVLSTCVSECARALCISAMHLLITWYYICTFVISDFLAAVIVRLCCTEFSNSELCTVCWSEYFGLWVPELPEPKFSGNLGTVPFLADTSSALIFNYPYYP